MNLLVVLTSLFLALTFYVYAGYPVLVGVWARLFGRRVDRADITPRISLIIAAYNEEVVIAEKLQNCLTLDYPSDKLEILVVVDGDDNTLSIARKYEGNTVVVLPPNGERGGKSAALNRAAKHATGDILVFSDANAYYLPDALKKLVRNFNDPTVGGVSGKKTVRASADNAAASEGLYWKYETFIKQAESRCGSTAGVVGEINAIRKTIYEDIPENIINDDFYLALMSMRKRYRVIYEPQAVSWELPSLSIGDDVKRRRRMTAGRYQQMLIPRLWLGIGAGNLFRVISHKFARLVLPFFMAGALGCNALLMVFPSAPFVLVVTFVAQLLAYGLAIIGYVGEKQGRKSKIPAVFYYIVSSNIASLRGLLHYFDAADVRWEKAQRRASQSGDTAL